ncbi:MAG TPA: aminopeptidase N [Gammaproteobacteria bacterium]|nr:aminopeptidase N [Gammaproteobacteria bacterium]
MKTMKTESLPTRHYLKDYKEHDYQIDKVDLNVELHETKTIVHSVLHVTKKDSNKNTPLILDGEDLTLLEISIDNIALKPERYQLNHDSLIIHHLPTQFTLTIQVMINPKDNSSLTGLYVSSNNFCTQCESHGFRKITYFIDRPDNLSIFTTKITASKTLKSLLSNGNIMDSGEEGNLHWVSWHDPFPKPSYLFALVAGNFDEIRDTFTTRSGRKVELFLYVEIGKKSQGSFAMNVLKNAMKWDEHTYDREYDLDRFMTVAVSDFNFGAMENKGLNIFNDRFILANSQTATDADFLDVDRVVAHEYFHNWSGNRITCRDWFQLSLKEGLTVLREHNYMASVAERAVIRITEAKFIQTFQYQEDAGPMSHPIRPDSYIEMNNFYTATVYEKGAEVIRMMQTIMGSDLFKQALNVYFERFDGQAVTTDDFVDVMQEISNHDFALFRHWYSQAGTPHCDISSTYKQGTLTLTLNQATPKGNMNSPVMHLPILISFVDNEGVCNVRSEDNLLPNHAQQFLLPVKERQQTFVFSGFTQQPILSVLDDFSAPISINYPLSMQERLTLIQNSPDGYQRWYQMNQVWVEWVSTMLDCQDAQLPQSMMTLYQTILHDATLTPGLISEILAIPSDRSLLEHLPCQDITMINKILCTAKVQLANAIKSELMDTYHQSTTQKPYQYSSEEVGKRNLRSLCLSLLVYTYEDSSYELCLQHYHNSDNMTDRMAAITALVSHENKHQGSVLSDFYQQWKTEGLVLNKWFAIQSRTGSLDAIKALFKHDDYQAYNPNMARALLGQFAHFNTQAFHHQSGRGYQFLAENILQIQDKNPQLAAGLLKPLIYWKRYDESRQGLMKNELNRIYTAPNLSKNIYELIKSSL